MFNFFLKKCVFLFCLLFLLSQPIFAAEVYYFGNTSSSSSEKNPRYSAKERINDLLDFSSKRPLADRSGKISGSLMTHVEYDKVSGNKSKSFLDKGWDYNTELNLNLQEKMWQDYNMEGQMMLRKTDNPRVESRRDVRVKDFQVKLANPKNIFLFGDFYSDLSAFTLSTSLEGFAAEIQPNDLLSIKHVIARQYAPDEAASKFQRNVFGSKADFHLFRDNELFSNVRLGFQTVTTQDDSSDPDRTSSFKDLRNTVFSQDGEISFVKYLSLNYEVARSLYLEDEDSQTIKDQSYGNAFKVTPQLQFKNLTLRHLYAYTQPDFYTDTGSAASDKIQHQTTLDHRFNKRASVSLNHNYHWDHLTGSSKTKRTINDEKNISFNFLPLVFRESFRTRVYSGYNLRTSDDAANTLESRTFTAGFGINDRFGGTDVGFSYEYRAFSNRHDKSLSDFFNRFGFTFAREYSILERRLYLSLNPGMDIRRTKTDTNNDINLSVALSGQYDIAQNLITRFGHNLTDSNNAKSTADFTNNKSYAELDWTLGQNKDLHFVLRGDINRYMHADGTLNYKEHQAILKCVLNF